jgi:hypothetical protein
MEMILQTVPLVIDDIDSPEPQTVEQAYEGALGIDIRVLALKVELLVRVSVVQREQRIVE